MPIASPDPLQDFLNPDLPLPNLQDERHPPELDPDVVLSDWETTPEGPLPRWWPKQDPRNGRPLSLHQRHRWFREELAANLEAFSASRTSEPDENATSRKHSVARSLLLMRYAVDGQAVSTPDWL